MIILGENFPEGKRLVLCVACYITGNSTRKPNVWQQLCEFGTEDWLCGVCMQKQKNTLTGPIEQANTAYKKLPPAA
jgi:hypothetical protein